MVMHTRAITYFNCVPVIATYEIRKGVKISTQYRLYLFADVKPICLRYYITVTLLPSTIITLHNVRVNSMYTFPERCIGAMTYAGMTML